MSGYQILSAQRYSTHLKTRIISRRYAVERGRAEPHFYGKVTPVDIVTEEEVPRVCRIPADLEELHQVELQHQSSQMTISDPRQGCPTNVLAMDVAADGDRRLDLQKVGFGLEDLGRLGENEERLVLGQSTFAVEMVLEERDVSVGNARAVAGSADDRDERHQHSTKGGLPEPRYGSAYGSEEAMQPMKPVSAAPPETSPTFSPIAIKADPGLLWSQSEEKLRTHGLLGSTLLKNCSSVGLWNAGAWTSLTTLSWVDTTEPSSWVCRVKSISGTGALFRIEASPASCCLSLAASALGRPLDPVPAPPPAAVEEDDAMAGESGRSGGTECCTACRLT